MKVFVFKWVTIFMTGGMIYYSMIVCGGFATLLCGGLNQVFNEMSILAQMILSSVIISELEFVTGYVVNIILRYDVWDYSNLPFNLMGQICVQYSMLWMFLSVFIIFVDDYIRCRLFGEERPVYHLI